TQTVTDVLGVAPEKVHIVQGDTDRANGVGSVGSRSAFVGGSAVVAAGRRVIIDGKTLAAEALEAAAADIEYRDGRFRIAGTDRTIALGELAGRQERKLFRVSATETPSTPSWPNGAQACPARRISSASKAAASSAPSARCRRWCMRCSMRSGCRTWRCRSPPRRSGR